MPPPVLRLYTDPAARSGADPSRRVPWQKGAEASRDETDRRTKQQVWQDQWLDAPTPAEADWWCLPDRWAGYLEQGTLARAQAFADEAARHDACVLVWCGGDDEYLVPFENAIVVQAGTYRGLARPARFAFELPVFLKDPVDELDHAWHAVPWQDAPTVGFCGLAQATPRARLGHRVRQVRKHMSRGVRASPHGFATDLRREVLEQLERAEGVTTDFLVRDRYKAGEGAPDYTQSTARQEFLANMEANLYTVCVRGGGNFSKRLYETLALGRIPILVDTHSALPCEEFLDWSPYVVRVPHDELHRAGEIVQAFHATLDADTVAERQSACRTFWQDHLSDAGYYATFPRYVDVVRGATHG